MQAARFMDPPCYRSSVRATAILACLTFCLAGCGEEPTTSPDLGVGSSDQGDTLSLTVGGHTRAMAAYYSFYVEPLSEVRDPGVYLVVTAIDPTFDCAHPASGLDAVSFLFHDRAAMSY